MATDELSAYLDALEREDRYRVDAVLKQSPSETTQRVYLGREDGSERGPLIRKFIKRESGLGSAYERIFAAQQARQRFAHIPGIVECYTRDGELVVVMELVPGETLKDVVYRLDPSPQLAADLFPLICDAAMELHERFDPPIIHRDLKPTNVMVSQQNVALIDFGIARDFKEGADSDTTHLGTKAFAPPEQFGFGQTSTRSDVYALGMLLYFCLTEEIPAPSAREGGFADERIPAALRSVLVRATQFDPTLRYASVREMRDDFMRACDESMRASDDSSATQPQQPAASTQYTGTAPSTSHEETYAGTYVGAHAATPYPVVEQYTGEPGLGAGARDDIPRAGGVRNAFVAMSWLLLVLACVHTVFDPDMAAKRESSFFTYACTGLFTVPAWSGILGYALMSKPRLYARWPKLAGIRPWHYVAAVIAVAVATLVTYAVGDAFGLL